MTALISSFTIARINEEVIIRLKWGQTEYKGRLISVDSYMNVQLNGTEEFINGKSTGTLGQVLIRYATIHLTLNPGLRCICASMGHDIARTVRLTIAF